MSTPITFTPAVRANVPLLIGVMGPTGSGKTFTAMRLAHGLAGEKPFAVVDTESGRARHYADRFRFDHADISAPFRPENYLEAIIAAESAGYPVIVVDSVSHVWAGDGGVIDWQEEELDRMAGDNWQKREACKFASWIKPKTAHKKMVSRLLQLRAHVILCFRAEPKVEIQKADGKTKIVPKVTATSVDGWIPVCEKMLPFELTASFLLTADRPGVVKPIKLQEQHRPFVPLEEPITEETGRQLGEWARGGNSKPGVGSVAVAQAAPIDVQTLSDIGDTKAREGTDAFRRWWITLPAAGKAALTSRIEEWKQIASDADGRRSAA